MAGKEEASVPGLDVADDDDAIALFLESEVMEEEEDLAASSAEEPPPSKRCRLSAEQSPDEQGGIESGAFAKIPPEIFPKILKFLSSEDLSSCAKVCQYLRRVASDEPLWKRLYCLRWGMLESSKKKSLTWKQLYFERDRADVTESLRNSPSEFKQYYLQMQVAKREEAPPAKATDDLWVVDEPVDDEVTAWKRSHKLAENFPGSHACSGRTCSYHQIGDVYICEKTGRAHVCGDACRETVMDFNNVHVCTVSGRCFDPCMFSVEDEEEEEQEAPQVPLEEVECIPRFARAYTLGYNCIDDRELKAVSRRC